MSAWQTSLEEDIGVEQARVVVDHVDRSVGEEHLDRKLDEVVERLRAEMRALRSEMAAAWRRDMLLIAVPQFLALAAILAGVGA